MSKAPDDRPWERPGAVRRDCEPHRSSLLLFLAILSLIGGSLAICCGVTGIVGILLGVPTWVMARRDLRMMKAGVMDPAGTDRTNRALDYARVGTLIGVSFLVSYGLMLGLNWWLQH